MKATALILTLLFSSFALADSPVFTNSLEKARVLSKTYQKNIIVIFASSSCKYCDNLKSEVNNGTFDDLLENKIVCYLDITNDTDLINKYKVSLIPDSRFFTKETEQSKILGYEKNKYKKWLENLK